MNYRALNRFNFVLQGYKGYRDGGSALKDEIWWLRVMRNLLLADRMLEHYIYTTKSAFFGSPLGIDWILTGIFKRHS